MCVTICTFLRPAALIKDGHLGGIILENSELRFDVTYKGIYYRNICGRTAGNEPVTPPSCLEVGSSAQDRKLYVRPKGS